ncbi:hypothetical protein ONZ45_g4208 [Pleurotus djamor]|nr:hypothetical protein ONZ45_g4208 [Pleurotus djamor]
MLTGSATYFDFISREAKRSPVLVMSGGELDIRTPGRVPIIVAKALSSVGFALSVFAIWLDWVCPVTKMPLPELRTRHSRREKHNRRRSAPASLGVAAQRRSRRRKPLPIRSNTSPVLPSATVDASVIPGTAEPPQQVVNLNDTESKPSELVSSQASLSSSSTMPITPPQHLAFAQNNLDTCDESVESDVSSRPSVSSPPARLARMKLFMGKTRKPSISTPTPAPASEVPDGAEKLTRKPTTGFVPPWAVPRSSPTSETVADSANEKPAPATPHRSFFSRRPQSARPSTSPSAASNITTSPERPPRPTTPTPAPPSATSICFTRKADRRRSAPVPRTQPYDYPYFAAMPSTLDDEPLATGNADELQILVYALLIVFPLVFSQGDSSSTNPIPCFQNASIATITDLVACLEKFTVSFDFYGQTSYDLAQPTPNQLTAWLEVIYALLHVDGNCTSIILPAILDDHYSVTLFTELNADVPPRSFCVLSEAQFEVETGFYVKGWGLVVVPANRHERMLHFSAPHPIFDTNTAQQSAALFSRTNAKSLLVTGRIRNAFQVNSACTHPGPGDGLFFKTDPAHDDNEPFFAAAKVIRRWQNEQGGCPSQSCAFIQMHGKAASSCPSDTVFMSSGLGSSPSSVAWYTDMITSPIRRLQAQLRQTIPIWTFSLPSESPCNLVATTNIFGRLLNGIEEDKVCLEEADATTVSGEFIHLEQSIAARGAGNYDLWAEAFRNTYNLAQPTSIELRDWLDTIDALLHVDENCTSIQLPASLRGVYTISPFVEQEPSVTSRKAFCILSESHYNSASGYYRKGWGLFVVPASKPSLDLHFSAPHPVYDAGSAQQAAALFKRTGAKSLLITGRMRTAFKTPSTCITPSPGNGPYWRTDPTHEMDDPFFHTTKTIHRSQNENGGCRPESCAFIQMHGKAASQLECRIITLL